MHLQALGRSGQRSQRLQEALRGVRGNAALLEGLLAWLTEAHALLAAKAKDPVPDDLTVVEALVKEHLVSSRGTNVGHPAGNGEPMPAAWWETGN